MILQPHTCEVHPHVRGEVTCTGNMIEFPLKLVARFLFRAISKIELCQMVRKQNLKFNQIFAIRQLRIKYFQNNGLINSHHMSNQLVISCHNNLFDMN